VISTSKTDNCPELRNMQKIKENWFPEWVNKKLNNLCCPICDKTITDKDLKHWKCTKCGAQFKVKLEK
jgi:ribosomal protein L37AE/L43A